VDVLVEQRDIALNALVQASAQIELTLALPDREVELLRARNGTSATAAEKRPLQN
jgi:hypothetical protein